MSEELRRAVEAYLEPSSTQESRESAAAILSAVARAALEVIRPHFITDHAELPSLSLWEPGTLAPAQPGDEPFVPYVGQLFEYMLWDELDDVDCSLSTIFGRSKTISSLAHALDTEVVEVLGYAVAMACRLAGYYCSGAPLEPTPS